MSHRRILIWGGFSALCVWSAAFFVLLTEDDFESAPAEAPVAGMSAPEMPIPQAPEAPQMPDVPLPPQPGEPSPGEPLAQTEPTMPTEPKPITNTPAAEAGSIPKAPRKTLDIFHAAGEICVDAETGKMLAGTNIRRRCPPASVTKLMTLYLTLEAIQSGKIAEDTRVLASKRAYGMGGTQLNLDVDEPCRIDELIYGLMLQSANDAAVVLAETISGSVEDFVAAMNRKAELLDLKNTRFETPHGLPPSRKERAAGKRSDMTTAEDLAKLSIALIKDFPDSLKYAATITRYYPANEKRPKPMPMKNHNRLLETFEGCDGLKTGWTNDGASIVTTASRGNRRVIAVVLGGLVKNKKGDIDAKTSQRERNQRAAELMYRGLQELDALRYAPTPAKPFEKTL